MLLLCGMWICWHTAIGDAVMWYGDVQLLALLVCGMTGYICGYIGIQLMVMLLCG